MTFIQRTVLASLAVALSLNGQPTLTIDTNSLPYGTIGQAYTAQLQASGGSGSYSWTIVQGNLPPGLSLNLRGGITGAPTAAGMFTFVVQVLDLQTRFTATKQLSIGVPQITTQSPLPNAIVGTLYSVTFEAAYAPPPFVWSSTATPPGLNLNTQGVLTGIPTMVGVFNFTVTAFSDRGNASATAAFTLTVFTNLSITTTSPLPPGMVGVNYSLTFTASGGIPPYTFTVPVGGPFGANTLPAGLTMNQAGFMTGIPTTVGPQGFNINVTDSTQTTVGATFSLTVTPALLFTTASPLPPGTAGNRYSQSVTASGGTPPYTFSIVGSPPPGLTMSSAGVLSGTATAAGTFPFTVQTIDSLKFTATKLFQLTISPAAALLQVSVGKLEFSAFVGGDAASSQTVSILPTGARAVNFAVQVDGGGPGIPAPSWLTVKPLGGTSPGRLVVTADPGKMSAGTSPAGIHVTVPQDTTQAPIDIPVSFTISTRAPRLEVSPTFLRFAARVSTPATLEQAIVVRNSGGGGPLSFTISTIGQSPWMVSVSPAAGSTAPDIPVVVRVRVNTQGLDVGYYHGLIRIDSAGGFADVPVVLFVSDHGAIISVNVTGVRFQSAMPQTVSVLNVGDPGSIINWSADLVSGSDWLNIAIPSGTAATNGPGILSLIPTGPGATGKYALVRVSDRSALNSPQYVVAVEDNLPATPPQLDFSTAGLFFAVPQGSQPITQTFQVFANSSAQTTLQTATATADGGSWLTANPASVGVTSQNPAQITVTLNPTGVTPGIRSGSVNVSAGGILGIVNVTFVETPPASVPQGRASAACTPSGLALTQTGMVNNFAVPAGWPASLTIQLNDDCGSPVSNGSVVASFSNGDAPLTLRGDQSTNMYSATWQPGVVLPQITITVRANAGSLLPVTQQFIGTVGPNNLAPPTLVTNGTLHIFFDSPTAARLGGGLAPGTVSQVYGTGLASADLSPGVVPLLTEFNGTFMLIGGLEAPLFYVSGYLLDIQVPVELTPNRQYAAVVSANGALTMPETVDVVPLSPGMAAFPDGRVIAQHTDPAIPRCTDYAGCLDATHPAKPGETLTIYLAGMGSTTPMVKSGDPTPLTLIPTDVRPKIFVDGQEAFISYAGLTPTGVGLYFINFVVPPNARTGTLNVVVTQNGIVANTTTLPVVR